MTSVIRVRNSLIIFSCVDFKAAARVIALQLTRFDSVFFDWIWPNHHVKTTTKHLILAAVISLGAGQAQQSPSPSTPPQTAQAQTAPCTTGPSQAAAPQNNKSGSSFAGRLKKKINDEAAKIGTRTGVPMPTTDDISSAAPAKPVPCSPKPPAPASPAPVFHAPTGVVTTWLCNPVVTASDHSTSYVMQSDITEASPIQANTFEADSAKADPKATTSCSSLHKDPKTLKFWLAQ